jgi:hypothetical protein
MQENSPEGQSWIFRGVKRLRRAVAWLIVRCPIDFTLTGTGAGSVHSFGTSSPARSVMSDFRPKPPDVHPEFGYFCISVRLRRRMRWMSIGVVSLAMVAVLGQVSTMARHFLEARQEALLSEPPAALPPVRSPPTVAAASTVKPFPTYRRKRQPPPDEHPYARLLIGFIARMTEPHELATDGSSARATSEKSAII